MDCINKFNSECTQQIVSNLSSITQTWLAEWFINNYIHRCAQVCSHYFRCTGIQETVSNIVRVRMIMSHAGKRGEFTATQFFITHFVPAYSLTVRQCLFWMTELAKLDRDLPIYFTAVAFLHVAHKTARKPLEDGLLDVLATACLQSNDYTPLSLCTT